jgi:hypothetical protein
MATSPKRPTQTPTRSHVDYTANHLRKTTSQNIMKGVYINGKIESFGTRLVQWQDTRGPDIQAKMNQLGELRLSVQNLQIQGNLNRLLQTIEDGTVYSGMDDSHKDGHGTVAFRIQNDLGDQITGCNITPGLQEHQSPYRSELGWIVGMLVLLDLLQQHYDLRIQQFVITCDCNGAGLKSLTYHRPPTANNDNYDRLTQAYKIKTKATIDIVYQWVEGHQADQYGNQQLDKYGLLNDEMDKLANQYREETKHMNLPPQQIFQTRNGIYGLPTRKSQDIPSIQSDDPFRKQK